jgi:hypothetical protein
MNWWKKEAQAKKFPINSNINITNTGELVAPKGKPKAFPFQYVMPMGNAPETIRWVWNPRTGEMRMNPSGFHAQQIKKDEKFDQWVRGFYFPKKKLVAIRPYFSPSGAYDNWDASHAALNENIVARLTQALNKAFPGAKIEQGVDNQWLKNNINPLQNW